MGGEGGFAPGGEKGVELVEENGILGKDGKIEKALRPEKRRGFEGEDGLAETGLGVWARPQCEVGEIEGKGELGLGGGSVTTEGQETGLGATKLSEKEIVLVLVLIFVGDLEENAVSEVEEEFFVNVRIFGGARLPRAGVRPLR